MQSHKSTQISRQFPQIGRLYGIKNTAAITYNVNQVKLNSCLYLYCIKLSYSRRQLIYRSCLCVKQSKGVITGVFKLFSWRPKFHNQNLTRPKQNKCNLPKIVRGVSLLSFTKLIKFQGYFGYFDPHSAKWFCCSLLFTIVRLGFSCFIFIFWGVTERPPTQTFKPLRPKFGARPIV